jgi:hypothetical protein
LIFSITELREELIFAPGWEMSTVKTGRWHQSFVDPRASASRQHGTLVLSNLIESSFFA